MNLLTNDPITLLIGDWASELSIKSIAFRVILSLVLAAIIGCERSSKRHSAGLRTFIIVAVSSTIAMVLDTYISQGCESKFYIISAATILGISMISVNSMLVSSRNQIKGLTTATGIWFISVIGLSSGAGLYTIAIIAFVVLMVCVSILPSFELFLKDRSNHFEVHLELTNSIYLQNFVTTIRRLGLKIDDIEINPAYVNSGLSVYSIAISITSDELKKYKTHKEIIEALSTLDYVYHIEEMHR